MRQDIVFSGPNAVALGSTWNATACLVTVQGNFGPVGGDGAWTDYSNGGGGPIPHAGGPFSLTLTSSLPNAPRGPYLGLADPCNAAPPPVYQYNLNIFFPDCVDRCQGVVCNDGNPCTDDVCNPGTGACAYPPRSGTCGSTGGGMCIQGKCIVEVEMNVGQSGDTVCASQGLTCSEVPVLAPPEAGCKAFHPTATVSSDFNGWRQCVYCDDDTGLACPPGQTNDCHHCPLCRADALPCDAQSTSLFTYLYAECVP